MLHFLVGWHRVCHYNSIVATLHQFKTVQCIMAAAREFRCAYKPLSDKVISVSLNTVRPPGVALSRLPVYSYRLDYCSACYQFRVCQISDFSIFTHDVLDIQALPTFRANGHRNYTAWLVRVAEGCVIFKVPRYLVQQLPVDKVPVCRDC